MKYKLIHLLFLFISLPFCEAQGIKIGNQQWMTKNLDVTKFKNGDIILEVYNDKEWNNALNKQIPAYCFYDYDKNNYHDKIYNWYAVIDYRGLAPLGWKIPSKNDYVELVNFLGNNAGTDLKSANWLEKVYQTLDYIKQVNPGFNALPEGMRSPNNYFAQFNEGAVWWTCSQADSNHAYILGLLSRNGGFVNCCDKLGLSGGAGVRCIKE
jgi:uncharacterized protein (TIGR02145 family)